MAGFVSLCVSIAVVLQGCLAQQFRDSPANSTALTTYPHTLRCSAPDPAPPSAITWFHNNMPASANSRISITYDADTGSSQYMISSVSYFDAGAYQCFALDAQGQTLSSSVDGTLTVLGRPAFSPPLPAVEVSIGGQAVFMCSVLSNPPATVSWAFGHPPQSLSTNQRIVVANTTLTINNVRSSDEGFYECIANNSYGRNSTSGRLTIAAPTSPPVPLSITITPNSPNPYPLTIGDPLVLRCQATGGGSVTPTLSWLKDSKAVSQGVTRDSSGLLLSIPSVQEVDRGVYTCVATSAGGNTSATVTVEVDTPPTFQVRPENITTRSGQTLLTPPRCTATGTPPPTITWQRPNGAVVMVTGGVPQFGTLQRSDNGVYVCVARNRAGENRTEFTITVEAPAQITEPPQNTESAYGQDVVFRCVAVGPPTPNITWIKIGSEIQDGSVATANELHLFSVTNADSGTYQCAADNGLGTDTASGTLTISNLPMVRFISPATHTEVGRSFVLNCTVSGPPSTTLRWYHNTTLLPNPSTPGVQISPSGILTVSSAAVNHSGEYTCNASTSYGYSVAHVTVTVGTVPQITTGPVNTDLTPGVQTFLNCGVTGLPRPHTRWYKTDVLGIRRELPIVGSTFTVHTQGLELHDVGRNDTGMYECRVENVFGSTIQTASVRVEGTPLATSITPTLLVAGNTFSLTCNLPYNYPTSTVSWTRVDGTSLPFGRSTIGTDGVLTFSPVQAEDEGEYLCTATNSYGESSVRSSVTVHVPPSITVPPTQPAAILDSIHTLQCRVTGRPTPSIQWALPDGTEPVDITDNPINIDSVPYSFNRRSGELRISRVKAADAGTYNCTASNIVGNTRLQVQVEVKGAAPLNLNTTFRSPTAVGFTWDLPPPELSGSLESFQAEFGLLGSHDRQVISIDKASSRQFSQSQLEEATAYVFIVRGLYEGGVVGEDAVVIVTTLEDAPSAAPQNVTLVPLEEQIQVSWEPPELQHQNGAITHYNIYHRRTPDNNTNSTTAYTLVVYSPETNDSADTNLTILLDDLESGQSYDVKLQAATAVGPGPNTTVYQSQTLTPFPLTLVLSITIPVGTVLVAVVLLLLCLCCVLCLRRRAQIGKHTPLMEERAFQKQKKEKRRRKTVSGPIPGITPHIDSSVPGKFTVQARDGTVLSLNPKVIMEEDVAPPPVPGQPVQQVPRKEILKSQEQPESASFNDYSAPADSLKAAGVQRSPASNTQPQVTAVESSSTLYSEPVVIKVPPSVRQEESKFDPYADDIDPYAVSRKIQTSDVWQQPIQEEEEEEDENSEEEEEEEEDRAENELTSSGDRAELIVTPALPASPTPPTTPQMSDPAPETMRDDVELLYATVSHEHKIKKRNKRLQQQQKHEMKARRDQRKMQEKMRREQEKREAKARQQAEKERKKRQKEEDRRHQLGLGNVVRLHEVDLSSQKGKAQAQFIDAATAAIF